VIARVVAPTKQVEPPEPQVFLGSSCSFVPLAWTEIQAKFNRASRPPQGFSAADPGIVEYYTT
jgi:hypothetical protein